MEKYYPDYDIMIRPLAMFNPISGEQLEPYCTYEINVRCKIKIKSGNKTYATSVRETYLASIDNPEWEKEKLAPVKPTDIAAARARLQFSAVNAMEKMKVPENPEMRDQFFDEIYE